MSGRSRRLSTNEGLLRQCYHYRADDARLPCPQPRPRSLWSVSRGLVGLSACAGACRSTGSASSVPSPNGCTRCHAVAQCPSAGALVTPGQIIENRICRAGKCHGAGILDMARHTGRAHRMSLERPDLETFTAESLLALTPTPLLHGATVPRLPVRWDVEDPFRSGLPRRDAVHSMLRLGAQQFPTFRQMVGKVPRSGLVFARSCDGCSRRKVRRGLFPLPEDAPPTTQISPPPYWSVPGETAFVPGLPLRGPGAEDARKPFARPPPQPAGRARSDADGQGQPRSRQRPPDAAPRDRLSLRCPADPVLPDADDLGPPLPSPSTERLRPTLGTGSDHAHGGLGR